MKLLIAVDMEGITGVSRWEHVTPGHAEYERFRRLMTADVNAAIAGACDAGADEILVSDGHADGQNIMIELLDPRASINEGNAAPYSMVQGADSGLDAAIFIGYHARMGSLHGVLDHTWSSTRVSDVWLNGQQVGETALNSAVLGSYGVPVLMISGDQTVAAEASAWIPGIETAIVKKATSRYSAECLPPDRSQALIRETAARAIRNFRAGKGPGPVTVSKPVTVTIAMQHSAQADGAEVMPGVVRLDGRKLEIRCDNMPAAYFAFRTMIGMASR